MGSRRWRVRRFMGHSERLVVLPDDGSPTHDRRDPEYDDYVRKTPSLAKPVHQELPEVHWTPTEKRVCPVCGRTVRYNLDREYYYSHTLPKSTTTCSQSGRP
jgi:hypothetical protein